MYFHQSHNSVCDNHNIFEYEDTVWESHFHRNAELIYIKSGEVRCTVNGVCHSLRQGEWGMCLPLDIHRYEPCENTLYWVLVFSTDYVSAFEMQTASMAADRFSFPISEEVEAYVLSRLVNNPSPTAFTLKSCLYAICEEYLSSVRLTEKSSCRAKVMSMIADFVTENYRRCVSLSELAKRLGYDYHYMSRSFHRMFDMSFSDFVNAYRLECAVKLLAQTDLSITEIAFESGFGSVRSFNNCFLSKKGISPSEYRKKLTERNKR